MPILAIIARGTAHIGEIRVVAEGALDSQPLFQGQSARERAIEVLAHLRVWDTAHNNGLLIYLLLADRAVQIVTDRGLHTQVGAPVWEHMCRQMETLLQQAHYEAGVLSGVQAVTQQLVAHCPCTSVGLHTLPDQSVILSCPSLASPGVMPRASRTFARRFSCDSNKNNRNITEGARQRRYSCPDTCVLRCLTERLTSTGYKLYGTSQHTRYHRVWRTRLMNQDIFAGQWKQLRGELKSWWGKLTDDDFTKIGGQKDKLVGVVQEKYGYARERAEQEVERRLAAYGDTMNSPNGHGRQDSVAAGASEPARATTDGAMATAASAVADGWGVMEDAVATAATAVVDGAESVEGAISSAATAVAGGVESANTYLQEKTFDEMASDVTAVIRTYPVQSLLVGAALGYLFARLTAR